MSSELIAEPVMQVSEAGAAAPIPADNDQSKASTAVEEGPGQEDTPRTGSANLRNALQQGLNRDNLEEEVSQVVGALSSWWGGVKKQSATAFVSFKADADRTMHQLQADFEQLKTARVEIVPKASSEAPQDDASKIAPRQSSANLPSPSSTADESSVQPASSDFLGRISSSTAQLQQNLQSTLQATINKGTSLSPAQLRTQIADNLRLASAKENIQTSMKQAEKLAEEYIRKGDKLVKDAEKWMEDAVKVVPPQENDIAWDGSDWYTFTTSARPATGTLFDVAKESQTAQGSHFVLPSSRKDALLRRLREDRSLLLVDPADPSETSERQHAFRDWLLIWAKDGQTLRAAEEGNAAQIRMALVPEHLTDDQFWQRYLFHLTMIEAGEAKRKQLLEDTQNLQPENFSWDDEPEESSPPPVESKPKTEPAINVKAAIPATTSKPSAQALSSATSPRDSEESYDLVSDQGKKVKPPPPAEEDDDSDWE